MKSKSCAYWRGLPAARKRRGRQVNARRIQRIWQEGGLQVPRRIVGKRRVGPQEAVKLARLFQNYKKPAPHLAAG